MTMKKTFVIGRTKRGQGGYPGGCSVEIEVELRSRNNGEKLTVDLEPISEYFELSVCGSIWNHIRTDIYSGGQNLDEILRLFPKNPTARRLHALWKRWHLNGMKAGTRRQSEALEHHG